MIRFLIYIKNISNESMQHQGQKGESLINFQINSCFSV
jgi:hypothetical protein